MDFTEIKDFVGWIIAGILVNLVTIGGAIFVIIKGAVMLKREAKSGDLSIKDKELDYTAKVEQAADKAAEKALGLNQQLTDLRIEMQVLTASNKENDLWRQNAESTMKSQAARITFLECKLVNSEKLIKALAYQVVELEGTPVTMESLSLPDCKEDDNGSKS